MNTLSSYPNKFYIGSRDNEKIYLSAPSWDCGWYWGFGYLGNKHCHYHVDGLTTREWYDTEKKCFQFKRVNLFDGFRLEFGDTFKITDADLWTLCELFETFYHLKESAEVFGRGGCHMTTNPLQDTLKDADFATKINNVLLPQVFEEIYRVLLNAETRFNEFETAKKAKERERLEADVAKAQAKLDAFA